MKAKKEIALNIASSLSNEIWQATFMEYATLVNLLTQAITEWENQKWQPIQTPRELELEATLKYTLGFIEMLDKQLNYTGRAGDSFDDIKSKITKLVSEN